MTKNSFQAVVVSEVRLQVTVNIVPNCFRAVTHVNLTLY